MMVAISVPVMRTHPAGMMTMMPGFCPSFLHTGRSSPSGGADRHHRRRIGYPRHPYRVLGGEGEGENRSPLPPSDAVEDKSSVADRTEFLMTLVLRAFTNGEQHDLVGRVLLVDVGRGEALSRGVLADAPRVPSGYAALEIPIVGTGAGIAPGDEVMLLSVGECAKDEQHPAHDVPCHRRHAWQHT